MLETDVFAKKVFMVPLVKVVVVPQRVPMVELVMEAAVELRFVNEPRVEETDDVNELDAPYRIIMVELAELCWVLDKNAVISFVDDTDVFARRVLMVPAVKVVLAP